MLSIEAPGFYLKQGYGVAATIDCEPPGLTRYYTVKTVRRDSRALCGCKRLTATS